MSLCFSNLQTAEFVFSQSWMDRCAVSAGLTDERSEMPLNIIICVAKMVSKNVITTVRSYRDNGREYWVNPPVRNYRKNVKIFIDKGCIVLYLLVASWLCVVFARFHAWGCPGMDVPWHSPTSWRCEVGLAVHRISVDHHRVVQSINRKMSFEGFFTSNFCNLFSNLK